MEGKVCCFIGHRKIDKSIELTQRAKDTINDLIKNKGVQTFLFGSRSEFDDLCHEIVTELQKKIRKLSGLCIRVVVSMPLKKKKKKTWEKVGVIFLKEMLN